MKKQSISRPRVNRSDPLANQVSEVSEALMLLHDRLADHDLDEGILEVYMGRPWLTDLKRTLSNLSEFLNDIELGLKDER
jgi:hypothetical protein